MASKLSSAIAILSLALILGFYSRMIERVELKKPSKGPNKITQANYEEYRNSFDKVILFTELGRYGRPISSHIKPGYGVNLNGFTPGTWYSDQKLSVNWHLRADHSGTIDLDFLPNALNSNTSVLSLYLSDIDSSIRSALVKSGDWSTIVSELKGGLWIEIPLTKEEIALGKKKIHLKPFSGNGVCPSALILGNLKE